MVTCSHTRVKAKVPRGLYMSCVARCTSLPIYLPLSSQCARRERCAYIRTCFGIQSTGNFLTEWALAPGPGSLPGPCPGRWPLFCGRSEYCGPCFAVHCAFIVEASIKVMRRVACQEVVSVTHRCSTCCVLSGSVEHLACLVCGKRGSPKCVWSLSLVCFFFGWLDVPGFANVTGL